jgi:hypothetical protein
MKTRFIALLLFVVLLLGCGSNAVLNGKEYETYGLFNKEEVRSPNVKYNLIVGNVVWGIILAETIIAPVYFFGFSIYEPVAVIK